MTERPKKGYTKEFQHVQVLPNNVASRRRRAMPTFLAHKNQNERCILVKLSLKLCSTDLLNNTATIHLQT